LEIIVDFPLRFTVWGEQDLELRVEYNLLKVLEAYMIISTLGWDLECESEELEIENSNVALRIIQKLFEHPVGVDEILAEELRIIFSIGEKISRVFSMERLNADSVHSEYFFEPFIFG
jgi:hypothetical protein